MCAAGKLVMPQFKITSHLFLVGSAVLVAVEGLICSIYLLALPSDPKNAVWLGYSAARLILSGIIIMSMAAAILVAWYGWRQPGNVRKIAQHSKDKRRLMNWVVIGGGALFTIAVLAISVRHYVPEIFSTSYARILPMLVFLALVLFHSLTLAFVHLEQRVRWRYFWMFLLVLLFATYVSGALYHAIEINVDARRSDQVAWMQFTKKVSDSGFRDTGSRNFMPAYAYLQALFYGEQQSAEETFLSGKLINISLSIVMLGGVAIILRKHLPPLAFISLLMIIAFNLLIFKAPYYQPELLFYLVNFLIFYLSMRMLRWPTWQEAVLLGMVAAMGHYVKASVLPGLLAFTVPYFLKHIVDAWITYMKDRRPNLGTLFSGLIYIALVGVMFIGLLFPYLMESKTRYGRYFYNVNTTFYVWNDNWTQALNGTRLHGDQVGWPDMPLEEIPSFQKFVREHTWQDVLTREMIGLGDVARNVVRPYGMFSYQVLYAGLAAVLIILDKDRAAHLLKKNWSVFLFGVSLFSGYIALYAWYAPISGSTARFVSSLFVPFMFAVFVMIEYLAGAEPKIKIWRSYLSGQQLTLGIYWLTLILILMEVIFVIPLRLMELVF